jgi:3-dehydroquinate synthetase
VASDERDVGRRGVLNFGHTVAHALEAATDYRMSHGEAVAIGIVVETRLAERITGLPRRHADRIEALVCGLGLPVRPPTGIDPKRLAAAMLRDKKTRAGIVRCALPERIGRMPEGEDPTVPVDPARDILPLMVRN